MYSSHFPFFDNVYVITIFFFCDHFCISSSITLSLNITLNIDLRNLIWDASVLFWFYALSNHVSLSCEITCLDSTACILSHVSPCIFSPSCLFITPFSFYIFQYFIQMCVPFICCILHHSHLNRFTCLMIFPYILILAFLICVSSIVIAFTLWVDDIRISYYCYVWFSFRILFCTSSSFLAKSVIEILGEGEYLHILPRWSIVQLLL
jgi:hypothetical protein